jgi:hypothetical protein
MDQAIGCLMRIVIDKFYDPKTSFGEQWEVVTPLARTMIFHPDEFLKKDPGLKKGHLIVRCNMNCK